MKLKLYQQGGGLIYTPFIPEQWAGTDSKSSKSSGSSDEDTKLDPLDKEILGLMKDQNLIPSDIQMIYNRLIAFQRSTQSLSSMAGGTGSYRSAMPGMLQIMNLVSQAKYNKAMDEEIVKQMMKENAGNEPAIDGYGRMWVKDSEGNVKKISPDSFDREEHIPLSNSELLYLRERDPELAFNGQVFDDMRNMVGMTSVSKEIERIIKAFGTEEGQRYLSKEAAQAFLDLNSPDGLYKLTEKGPSKGLREVWSTIFDQLPTNMQNLLSTRAAMSGVTPKTFLEDLVLRNTNRTTDIDYDASASKAAGYETDPKGAKKEAAEQLTQDNYLMQIGTKRLVSTRAMIVPMGAKITDTGGMSAKVYTAGMPVDHSMKGLGMMTLSNFRVESEAAKAGDFSSASFGNRILRPTEYDGIVYDGSSELNIAMLPYKRDAMTGQLIPDLDLFAAYNKIQEIRTNNPNISQAELAQKAKELGYNLEELGYDYTTNTMTLKDTMPFITFSAYASEDVIDIPKTMKPFLEKVPKRDGKNIADKYNTITAYGTLNPSKNDKKLNNFRDTDRWDLYRGNVYIPMTNAARALLLSGIGEYIPKSEMTDFAARVTAREFEAAQAALAKEDPNYDAIASLGQFR